MDTYKDCVGRGGFAGEFRMSCWVVLAEFVQVGCGRRPVAASENCSGSVGGDVPEENVGVEYTVSKVGSERWHHASSCRCLCV